MQSISACTTEAAAEAHAAYRDIVLCHADSSVYELLVADLEEAGLRARCAKTVVGRVEYVTPKAPGRYTAALVIPKSAPQTFWSKQQQYCCILPVPKPGLLISERVSTNHCQGSEQRAMAEHYVEDCVASECISLGMALALSHLVSP